MICSIVPPAILRALAANSARSGDVADAARRTLERTCVLAAEREGAPAGRPAGDGRAASHAPHRLVCDEHGGTMLPGAALRAEGAAPSGDAAADAAYDAAGLAYRYFSEVHGRDSIDGRGMRLLSSVHYDRQFDNAFWNGRQMVYGDGDGVIFGNFTTCLDVIGHELAHGVTQHECGFAYAGQSGALNESVSDVFGSLLKQWHLGQSAADADWLIGAGLFIAPGLRALRSLRAPGHAYDSPLLGGKDPQPHHMRDYVETSLDGGGVHLNSGIPNHAFYLAAHAAGGNAWETIGPAWYAAIRGPLSPHATFADFAVATVAAAGTHAAVVRHAWTTVGVPVA